EKNQQTARLGMAEKILLELIKVENPLPLTRKTGLFHVAFLLPTRKDLGNTLIHYLQSNAPIDGASDHGYSEALYLT
ncbi:VOC family protein, partial [Enterococcus faecalis]